MKTWARPPQSLAFPSCPEHNTVCYCTAVIRAINNDSNNNNNNNATVLSPIGSGCDSGVSLACFLDPSLNRSLHPSLQPLCHPDSGVGRLQVSSHWPPPSLVNCSSFQSALPLTSHGLRRGSSGLGRGVPSLECCPSWSSFTLWSLDIALELQWAFWPAQLQLISSSGHLHITVTSSLQSLGSPALTIPL